MVPRYFIYEDQFTRRRHTTMRDSLRAARTWGGIVASACMVERLCASRNWISGQRSSIYCAPGQQLERQFASLDSISERNGLQDSVRMC